METIKECKNIKYPKLVFSIIIPIYNVNLEYLDICMKSIFDQSFERFEIILVDDGSNLECANRCDYYLKIDRRVRVIHQENQGVSSARNHGIDAATADWVMFVDADDWLETNACKYLYEYLQKNTCDILLFGAVAEYPNLHEKLKYGLKHETLYSNEQVNTREVLYLRAMGTKSADLDNIYFSWDKVYNRRFLIDNQIRYPLGLPKSEDKVFILECFEKMRSLLFVDCVLYHYRKNVSSACNKYSENADSDRILLANMLKTIALRMDQELGELKKESNYNKIWKQFNRFVFGITTDVLMLKYYHKDYPRSQKDQRIEAKAFLRAEPFAGALKAVKYSELSPEARIKKFMLTHGFVKAYIKMKERRVSSAGKIAG